MRPIHWLYITLLVALAVARLVQKVAADTGGLASRYLPLAVAVVLAIGVWAAMGNTPLLRRWLWRLWCWLLASVALCALVWAGYLLFTGALAPALIVVALVLLISPALLLLWRYSGRSNPLWQR